jgi:hypothetical protein
MSHPEDPEDAKAALDIDPEQSRWRTSLSAGQADEVGEARQTGEDGEAGEDGEHRAR